MWSDVKNFHLKHAVSATIPPASCRPSTANHENIRKLKTQMYLNRFYNGTNGTKSSMSFKRLSSSVSLRDTHDQTRRHSFFITPPSIPVIHDPTSHTKLAW